MELDELLRDEYAYLNKTQKSRKFVTVRLSDLEHVVDVYIDNGMVEEEDVPVIDRLWGAIQEANGKLS